MSLMTIKIDNCVFLQIICMIPKILHGQILIIIDGKTKSL